LTKYLHRFFLKVLLKIVRNSFYLNLVNPFYSKGNATREKAIAEGLRKYLKGNEKILDVGCGNGEVAYNLKRMKKVKIVGIDPQKSTNLIPFVMAKGEHLPFQTDYFECTLLIDVLHHTNDPRDVLKEASKVAKRIIIKDVFYNSKLQRLLLEIAETMFSGPSYMPLPYNYLRLEEWEKIFQSLKLRIIECDKKFKWEKFDPSPHVFFVLERSS